MSIHTAAQRAEPSDADLSQQGLVRLRDGSTLNVRATNAKDESALRAFLEGLCPEARRLRFFGVADIGKAAHWAATVDDDRYGLLAHDEAGVIVGHATYIQLDEKRAEVAVEVADHLHGLGLGTILIQRLAVIAEQRGITHFLAEVLPENRAMLDVFREGFDARVSIRDGIDKAEFLTGSWRIANKRFGESL